MGGGGGGRKVGGGTYRENFANIKYRENQTMLYIMVYLNIHYEKVQCSIMIGADTKESKDLRRV